MIPVLAASDFLGRGAGSAASGRVLASALGGAGAVHLLLPEAWRELRRAALTEARAFFEGPEEDKALVALERSPHHRGWSVLHNERDWREQLHLGRERPAACGDAEAWRGLEGPNPWPARPGESFRRSAEAHLEACASLGHGLARALAATYGWEPECHDRERAYLLMKLIAYHPQQPGSPPRRGVAAHVDFSLLTLLAQDGSGGLAIRRPGGAWIDVEPREDCLLLNSGEILEALSGGALPATPHRVIHHSVARARLSIPVFWNPPLEAWIHPRPFPSGPRREVEGEHVHRVLTGREAAFRFGEAEWRRKGLDRWCTACCG